MKKTRRVLLVVGILFAVVVIGGRRLLSSQYVADKVAARLSSAAGASVTLAGVDLGLGGSTVRRLWLFEGGADGTSSEPWLIVSEIDADVTLWQAIRGRVAVHELTLKSPTIVLHFARDGRLLTKLPKGGDTPAALPAVHLVNGTLTLDQEGRPAVTFTGINGDLHTEAEKMILTGRIDDPTWDDWMVNGAWEVPNHRGSCKLTCARAHLTQAKVEQIPLVPAKIWREVNGLEGDTSVELEIDRQAADQPVHYQLSMEPFGTSVYIPSISLRGELTGGTVIVSDDKVVLSKLVGRTAGGKIEVSGELDFRDAKESKLRFDVQARELDMMKLPSKWGLPSQITGKLGGQAKLLLTIAAGQVHTGGEGNAVITDARVGGFPARPIELTLHAAGRGFRFATPSVSALDGPPRQSEDEGDKVDEVAWTSAPSPPTPLPQGARGEAGSSPPTPLPEGARGEAGPSPPTPLPQAARGEAGPSPPTPLPRGEKEERLARSEPETSEWLAKLPGRISDELVAGIQSVSDEMIQQSKKVLSFLDRIKAHAPAPGETGYLEVKLGLDNADLQGLLKNLDIPLPFAVAGKVTLDLRVQVPTDTPRDLKSYRLDGTVSLPWVTLEDLRLEKTQAQVHYDNGILRLAEVTAQVPDRSGPVKPGSDAGARGTIAGSGGLELFPARDITADVKLKDIPLSRCAGLVTCSDWLRDQLGGTWASAISLRAPAASLRDLATWKANGSLSSEQLRLFGASLEKLTARFDLAAGQIQVADLRCQLEGGPLTGSADVTLKGAYPFQARLDLKAADLGVLERLTPGFRVPLAVGGRLTFDIQTSGTLEPMSIKARGKAAAANLALAKVNVGKLSFDWDSDGKRLDLEHIEAKLYRGEVKGSASFPVAARETGSLDLRFDEIDLGGLASNLPPLPVRLEGRAAGSLKGKLPGENAAREREWSADLTVRASQLKLQRIPAEEVNGSVTYKQKRVDYRFTGDTLGGTFRVEGAVPVQGKEETIPRNLAPPPAPEPLEGPQGSLRFDNLRLERIWQWLGFEKVLSSLRGSLRFELAYKTGPDGQLAGRGSLELSGLRWRETRFIQDVVPGWIVLEGQRLRFGLSSSELGGLVNFRGELNARQPSRGSFDLTVERVDLARLLVPWPELSAHFRGFLQARLRGSLGPSWSGSGSLGLIGATVYGIEMSEWRLPVDFAYSPTDKQGQINVHDSSVQFFVGRATGQASLAWGGATRLEGNLRFFDVELRHLLASSETKHFGSGLLTGQLTFGGNNISVPSDISANLNATLREAQALQFPVLRELVPFQGGRLSSATVFDNGTVRARLAQGLVYIERLSLQSRLLRLFVDGTVTLPEWRLDLNAALSNGGLLPPLQRLGRMRLIPGGQLMEAITQVARVTLSLHITGTVRSPTIQVQPLRRLTEELFRFLAA